jgi:alpha-glucosidase (family GH31 glycosyl hydrolase)
MTWASLEFQPEFTATAANIGYGQWSHDIGGHMNGIKVGHSTYLPGRDVLMTRTTS